MPPKGQLPARRQGQKGRAMQQTQHSEAIGKVEGTTSAELVEMLRQNTDAMNCTTAALDSVSQSHQGKSPSDPHTHETSAHGQSDSLQSDTQEMPEDGEIFDDTDNDSNSTFTDDDEFR